MKKFLLSMIAMLFAVCSWASKSEALVFSTTDGWKAITVTTAGTSSTGSAYEFSQGNISVTGTIGYCNVSSKKMIVYKSGTMVISAGGAVIDSVKVTYNSSCYPFAEAIPADGKATEKTASITTVEYVPAESTTSVSFSNVAGGKTEVRDITVYYTSSKATITADDASYVKITNESRETVEAGEVAPGNYLISVNSQEVGAYKLYQVTKNGAVVAPMTGANYYMVSLEAGDELVVTAKYPVAYYEVTFSDPSAVKVAGTETKISGPVRADAGYQFTYTLKDGYTGTPASGFYLTQDTTVAIQAPEVYASVIVDNADKVKMVDENRTELTLISGTQSFSAGNYMINSKIAGYTLNKVELNGTALTAPYGYYQVTLAEGDVLKITADYDPANSKVEFSLPYRKNTADVVKTVAHSGASDAQITGWPTGMFEAANGYKMTITLDEDKYTVDSVKINDVKVNGSYGVYTTTVTEYTSVEIFAVEKVVMPAVIVDNADKVKMVGENRTELTLISGTQSFSAGNYMINSKIAGYTLNKVELNGTALTAPYGYYQVALANGDTLKITADYEPANSKVEFSLPYRKNTADVVKTVAHSGASDAQITGWPTGMFEAANGYKMTITLDEDKYTVDSVKINDVKVNGSYGVYTTTVTEYTSVEIFAVEKVVLPAVIVDNANKVKMVNESYVEQTLVAGTQSFSAGNYMINSKISGYTLNKVELNGTVLTAPYGYYQVTLANGDTLKITADYEPANSKVEFSLPYRKNTADVVKTVVHSGASDAQITGWPTGMFEAANGYKMTITLDEDKYTVDSVKINDVKVKGSYGVYTTTITEYTSVEIFAVEKGYAQVIVDDANKVKLMNTSYQTIALIDGDQNKVSEGTYQISSQNSSYSINKVELNGVEVSATGSYWTVTLKKDDVLKITTKYDADTYAVTIKAPEGAITSVTTATGTVADYTSFDAPAGYKVTIVPNTSAYKINSVTVNGEKLSYYSGNISVTVKGETAIVIDATEKVANKFTINATNASAIEVYGAQYSSYYDSSVKVALANDGANEVTLAQDYSYIAIKKAAGSYITSVKVGDKEYTADYNGVYFVPVTNGMTVDVVCGEVVKDSKATIVLKGRETANYNFYMQDGERNTININADGTYDYEFASTSNTVSLGAYGSDMSQMVVYINGVQQNPTYEGGTAYTLALNNNDFVEIYLAGGESEYTPTAIDTVNTNSAITRNGKYVINGKLVIVKNGKQYSANGQIIK